MRRHGVPLAIAASLVGGAALLAWMGGEAAAAALRALAVVATFGLGAALLRRRRAGGSAPELISVVERHNLSRDAGVALVTAHGRHLLVGFGPGGVALLVELGPSKEITP